MVVRFGTNELATLVVKTPVLGVVAPTVPLILIEAVPVRLVTVPELGVPRTPPLITNEPAVPTLTPRAVATLVPRPETPVLIGRPVPLVRVTADGVPKLGVVRTGLVEKTATPVPVSSVSEFRSEAERAVVVAWEAEPRKRAREAVREAYEIVLPVRVGLVPKTAAPEPVSSDRAPRRLVLVRPLVSRAATPVVYVKKPWSPLAISAAVMSVPREAVRVLALKVRPVPVRSVKRSPLTTRLVVVAVVKVAPAKMAAPVKVGEAEKTATPVPVSSVSAAERLALVRPPVSRDATPVA